MSNDEQDADRKASGSRSADDNQAVDDSAANAETSAGSDDESAENDGEDDVVRVAQTPTSDALLTQIKNNRMEAEVRALGAGRTGSASFHTQRITALALIPLAIWFVVGVLRMATGASHAQAADWLSGPVQAVLMALFIVIGLRHAVIGIRVVAEDYVRGEPWFSVCVLASQAIAVLIGAASIAALIHLAL